MKMVKHEKERHRIEKTNNEESKRQGKIKETGGKLVYQSVSVLFVMLTSTRPERIVTQEHSGLA
jgi:hypothetical protein